MNRREMLMNMGAALMGATALSSLRAQVTGARILYFTKSAGFEHSVVKREGDALSHSERILTQMAGQYGVDVEATKDGGVFTAEKLKSYDVLCFYTTGDLTTEGTDKTPPMSPEGRDAFLAAVADGKPLVGIHTATDTFHGFDPYIKLIGGEFAGHGAQQEATMKVVDHSLMGFDGLGDGFRINDEWYTFKNINPDLHVLLVQETQGMTGEHYEGKPAFPATWARMEGRGKVAYTSMGHREDVWTNPVFQGVLLGLFAWALGQSDLSCTPNVKQVCPGILPE